MKTTHTILLMTGLLTGFSVSAADLVQTAAPPAAVVAPVETNTLSNPSAPTNAPAVETAASAPTNALPPIVTEVTTNGVRMNFRGAPLNLVLDYMSDAAGFVINKTVDVKGSVEVWSKEPVSKEEAVQLLGSVLKQNGYAMTRNGRILTIMAQDTAKTGDLEIVSGNNPDEVEKSDEVVTQIIPVRYASVSQLINNLQILLPTTATLTANESANSLILVATKTDIKRMLRIITALDTSIASVSSIKVIPLQYADAKETATLISQLFANQGNNQNNNNGRANLFGMFGGRGGGPGGMFGGPGGMFGGAGGRGGTGAGGGGGGGGASRTVVAVGDDRSNSLVISASDDLLVTIVEMVEKIDQPVTDITELRIFHLVNADPSETANQLAQLFPDESSSTTSSQSRMPFFMRGALGGGGNNRSSSGSTSEREKKMGRVSAVPDPRTSSLIVTASKSLMPQIAEMMAELDANQGRREVVKVYELQNADPKDVYAVLQDLFSRNNTRSQNSANNRSMLGNNNPLSTRQTSTTSATSGNTSGSGNNSMRSSNFGN
jgi:type II secretory pathway component GspD/PulD (secretin)